MIKKLKNIIINIGKHMSYFKEKKIILSQEDEEIFNECQKHLDNKKYPISDSIMDVILPNDFSINKKDNI